MNQLQTTIRDRFNASDESLRTKRPLWDEVENIFYGNLQDRISNTTNSRVFDHKISTLILESEARVMATTGTGKVKAISKNDQGSAQLMNLMLDKYIVPNANSQFPLVVKHRLMQRKSKIYGNAFAMIDWVVKRNGYVGPDLFLLNIRDVFPQVGAASIEDSDYITVRTYRPMSFFEGLKKQNGYMNIDKIITALKKTSGNKSGREDKDMTRRENDNSPHASTPRGDGQFEILMQFERDRWTYTVPQVDFEILRDGKNPNDDGEIPIVNKYGIPLDDDFMGLGDAERGRSMQYLVNSSWNLAMDASKMSIFPPVIFNKEAIIKSTIKRQAGANWLVRGNINNVAKALELSPQGLETHQALYNLANASILNMFGTTDTSVSSNTDSQFGKTPEALKQQAQRENSRDAWDKFYVDLYITQVNKKFVNMMSNKQSTDVQIRMFEPEIEKLASQYPEIREMYDEKSGKIKISKSKVGSVLYDYEQMPGSTFSRDQQDQLDNLQAMFAWLSNPRVGPYVEQRLQKEGTIVNFTELLTQIISKNVDNWDEIVVTRDTDTPGGQQDDQAVQQHQDEFMSMVEQLQGGGGMGGGMGQDMSQIPPQPQGMGQDMLPPAEQQLPVQGGFQ